MMDDLRQLEEGVRLQLRRLVDEPALRRTGRAVLSPGRYDAVFDRVHVRDRQLVVDMSVLRPEPLPALSSEFVLAQLARPTTASSSGRRFDRTKLAILVALGRRW